MTHNDEWPDIREVHQQPDMVTLEVFIPATLRNLAKASATVTSLPGILQLQWVIHYANVYFPLHHCNANTVETLHYLTAIPAGQTISLTLEHRPINRIRFTYHQGSMIFSSGQLRFTGDVKPDLD
ncbi:hypothetical protein [Gynuella sunshinyii]|uniref:ApeI dehydratase-like domain-containing protein n=1 Tax=Gynuella sunshinyii YC6258 TaxID=1445510 RepID=A0A0C5VRS2_9GAMM|nr:hypothetical protein [Gynuella sunshinyii]AJQ92969.1 hypothetical Protein YC6258_00919 [Gynuella sunshinyii YC6258]